MGVLSPGMTFGLIQFHAVILAVVRHVHLNNDTRLLILVNNVFLDLVFYFIAILFHLSVSKFKKKSVKFSLRDSSNGDR